MKLFVLGVLYKLPLPKRLHERISRANAAALWDAPIPTTPKE